MKFNGTPFLCVMDSQTGRKIAQFDADGVCEVPEAYTERMKKHFEVFNDAAKEPEKEPAAKKKTCKKCGQEFENQGLFLAHFRKPCPKGGD